ncbi:glycosyltransferase family 2 protein [Labrys monachus]|uniref:Glycosyltransferase involved in cell wall biosynthesis n=1 Tax=Labrys monachus TaxID=217067 RepID=A0ABU0FBX5_9HYPH|nr:glycosyltransferase family 2 protein [Labrys monachus]MDQ0392104.1 glycosyltransferase involved in cell wall biosynthesis [Labrys monachus]
MSKPLVTIVIPVLNERGGLEELVSRLERSLEPARVDWTILFVDDGSTDGTFAYLGKFHEADKRISAIALSRNFGKEQAIAAGLAYAPGDAVIIMDADLQHPPELVPAFIQRWREGYEVVFGQRLDRDTDGWLRRLYSVLFYQLFARLSKVPLPDGATDFLLLGRKPVDAFRRLAEKNRFSRGLFSWVGFRSICVPFHYGHRSQGRSKWSFPKLLGLALDSFFAFSKAPLRLCLYAGLLSLSLGSILGGEALARHVLHHRAPSEAGMLFLMSSLLLGIQLLFMGILGEYVGRIFDEVRARPLFIVDRSVGLRPESGLAAQPVAPGGTARDARMNHRLMPDDDIVFYPAANDL